MSFYASERNIINQFWMVLILYLIWQMMLEVGKDDE